MLQQQAQVVQDAVYHFGFPQHVKLDLAVQPMLQPFGVWQAALDGVARKQGFVHMQIGGVQRLCRAPCAGHQHAHFGKGRFGLVAKVLDGPLHVAQVAAAVAGFILAQGLVNVLDDGFAVPLAGAAVPVVQADFAAKMHHQGFERWGPGQTQTALHAVRLRWAPNRA